MLFRSCFFCASCVIAPPPDGVGLPDVTGGLLLPPFSTDGAGADLGVVSVTL